MHDESHRGFEFKDNASYERNNYGAIVDGLYMKTCLLIESFLSSLYTQNVKSER